jgi:hypothetical protein
MSSTITNGPSAGAANPRYLQRVDLRTALIVAGVFNAILGAAFAFAGWLVIGIAAQRGFLEQINGAAADLSSGTPLHLSALRLCVVWYLVVAGWTVAMTIVAGLATVIFNTVLRLHGGVELLLTDERTATPDVRRQAVRARRWVGAASTTAAGAAGRAANVAGRAASATGRGAKRLQERIPEPVLRFDAGSRFKGLLETGATPGRAPARTSAPAADAREAVETQSARTRHDEADSPVATR